MKLCMYLSVFFLITPICLFSQKSTNYLGLKEINAPNPSSKILFYCRKVNNPIKKGDFIWQSGILLTSTNDTLAVQANINWEKDEISIFYEGNIYVLFQEKVKAISIEQNTYVCNLIQEKGQLFPSYFELLAEGEINLLKKPEEIFYYKRKNQAATLLKRNKKHLQKILEHKEASKYINQHKLNPKSESDLIRIFEFTNQH